MRRMQAIESVLQKIASLVKEDKRIKGLWAVGSTATGKTDKYSDLDLYILVENQDYQKVFEERASFAEQLGEVLSSFEVGWVPGVRQLHECRDVIAQDRLHAPVNARRNRLRGASIRSLP
jgi:predicted nucleotidyltransferase